MERNKVLNSLLLLGFFTFFCAFSQLFYERKINFTDNLELIIGESSNIPATWVGSVLVDKNIPILILAGHADSQGFAGAGTPGEAVDKFGLNPMNPAISDELFWNLKLQETVVKIGKKKG